ncbi:hypothetical protein J7E88_12570 [Streptomyces sp. ISL-10]|uniref:hypothetical protein n=1 Tax=Streptomyces sp. ISL-10 TaxID=2819172 RepID=UPI001BEC0184|nr:hypothetical protein [Streptomyces sp. ISL-10]MBT2366119.1 hypothetical protein [Streptomyces sp. ISL-10]
MSRLLTVLARTGDAWDATVLAIKATPGRVRAALAARRHRRTALIVASVTLLVYLFSLGDLVVSASGRFTGAPVFQAAPGQLLEVRGPYLFEPVLAWYPTRHLAVFLSPVNLMLGSVVAVLVGCNIAVAAHAARQAASCRRTRYARLLGVLPAFLLGFACCVPTFLLVLGASTAAALLPVLMPLRPVFYPLTLLMLTGTLVWGTSRTGRSGRRTRQAGDTGDAAAQTPSAVPDT